MNISRFIRLYSFGALCVLFALVTPAALALLFAIVGLGALCAALMVAITPRK